MYQQYKTYINDQKNIDYVINKLKSWINAKEIDDKDINIGLLSMFISKNVRRDYNINNGILLDFPLTEQLNIMKEYIENGYSYAWGADHEIVKMIYVLWNKYMKTNWSNYNRTYPHNEIFNLLHTLKECLLEFQYDNNYVKIGRERYRNWHLLCFFPLLGIKGLDIFMKVIKLYYNDAQDMIMTGIIYYCEQDWITPDEFLKYLRLILSYWDQHENISYCTATGMISELYDVIDVFKNKNIDLFNDIVIKDIFDKYKIVKK